MFSSFLFYFLRFLFVLCSHLSLSLHFFPSFFISLFCVRFPLSPFFSFLLSSHCLYYVPYLSHLYLLFGSSLFIFLPDSLFYFSHFLPPFFRYCFYSPSFSFSSSFSLFGLPLFLFYFLSVLFSLIPFFFLPFFCLFLLFRFDFLLFSFSPIHYIYHRYFLSVFLSALLSFLCPFSFFSFILSLFRLCFLFYPHFTPSFLLLPFSSFLSIFLSPHSVSFFSFAFISPFLYISFYLFSL